MPQAQPMPVQVRVTYMPVKRDKKEDGVAEAAHKVNAQRFYMALTK